MDAMFTDDSIAPAGFGDPEPEPELLSYDDTVPYEEQVLPETTSLANRIGRGKIYLLADAAGAVGSKRKANGEPEEDEAMMDEDGLEEDPDIRSNALFFTGPPIAHLPTTRIFAYATHFEAHPLGLEWVSDTTCVLVFSSKAEARRAYDALQKTPGEDPSPEDGSVTAKSIPVTLWPAEERISRTLAQALGTEDRESERERRKEGLSGPLRMRWARKDDVKKKGARNQSEFYRKHGPQAGKELVNGRDMPSIPSGSRKRRRDDEEDEALTRARLDRELDAFLAEESDEDGDRPEEQSSGTSLAERFSVPEDEEPFPPASPPSKMRSDYIADDGRTVIRKRNPRAQGGRSSRQRGTHSEGRWKHNAELDSNIGRPSLSDRIQDSTSNPLDHGRDRKRRRGEGSGPEERRSGGGRHGDGERRGDRNARPKKTRQELDDELDAFLMQT